MTAEKVEACPVPIWDGPYKMTCGYVMQDGVCVRHGEVSTPPGIPPCGHCGAATSCGKQDCDRARVLPPETTTSPREESQHG